MDDRMPPVHPGEILQEEFLVPLNVSPGRLAADTGLPLGRLRAILAGRRAVSADTAVRLGMFFGTSPEFWLRCQERCDLEMLEHSGGRARIAARVRALVPDAPPEDGA